MTTLRQLLADKKTVFQVDERKEVLAFIKANPAVIPLIKEAIPRIRKKFGDDVDFGLELFNEGFDPDETMLFLKVLSALPPEVEMKKFEELCFEWWLLARRPVGSKLNIMPASKRN